MKLPRVQFTVRRMMAEVAVVAMLLGTAQTVGHRYDCREVLLGPILLIQDAAPGNKAGGLGLSVLLAILILRGIVWPRPGSILLTVLAGLAWLFFGVLGMAINC
jgi:hypothetical protein